jgi:hypothetical protein
MFGLDYSAFEAGTCERLVFAFALFQEAVAEKVAENHQNYEASQQAVVFYVYIF